MARRLCTKPTGIRYEGVSPAACLHVAPHPMGFCTRRTPLYCLNRVSATLPFHPPPAVYRTARRPGFLPARRPETTIRSHSPPSDRPAPPVVILTPTGLCVPRLSFARAARAFLHAPAPLLFPPPSGVGLGRIRGLPKHRDGAGAFNSATAPTPRVGSKVREKTDGKKKTQICTWSGDWGGTVAGAEWGAAWTGAGFMGGGLERGVCRLTGMG